MKISTKGRYGLRLMLDLATNAREHGKVSLQQVAGRQGISEKYLWHIANRLKAAGLINAVSGLNGGYALNRDPEDISLSDILEALEGELSLAPCIKESSFCVRSESCASREVWRELSAKVNDFTKSINLKDIIDKHSDVTGNGSVFYNI